VHGVARSGRAAWDLVGLEEKVAASVMFNTAPKQSFGNNIGRKKKILPGLEPFYLTFALDGDCLN
jgi:hypothetical protein